MACDGTHSGSAGSRQPGVAPATLHRVTHRLARAAYQAIGMILTDHRVSSFHRRLYRRTGGRGIVGHALGVPMILLTTTGRNSGLPRTSPLVAIRAGEAWLVVGSNGGREQLPAWVHNLRADSRASVRYRGEFAAVLAHEAHGDERDRAWRVVTAAYPGFSVYQERTAWPIPVFALEPG